MDRADAIRQLQDRAADMRARGATALYLFGSTARNAAGAGSDLDLFLDYDATRRFSLLDLVDMKLHLEAELGVPVDLTTRDSLHPALRPEIERTALRVF
ncbi:nucleotidyltransferase family protein [Xanthobacteraceae bacterium A53D]